MARQFAFTSFLPVLVLLLAASCTSEMPGTPADSGQAAITFHTPATTRAAVDDAFPSGAQFSVWGWYDNNGTVGNPFDGETVTNNNGAWTYDGIRYWVLDAEYDFYAVYPAGLQNITCSDAGVITVQGFDASKTGTEAIDLMTASATGIKHSDASSIAPVSLEFGHELAKVSVVVRTDPGITATVNHVSLYGISASGDFSCNLAQGSSTWDGLSNAVDADDTSFKNETQATISPNSSANVLDGLLLIPQDVKDLKLDIELSRNNGNAETQTLALGVSTLKWVAGQHYQYVLTVKVDAITFSDFTVPEWEESGTGGNVNIGSDTTN